VGVEPPAGLQGADPEPGVGGPGGLADHRPAPEPLAAALKGAGHDRAGLAGPGDQVPSGHAEGCAARLRSSASSR
jgi:hypothetical protein